MPNRTVLFSGMFDLLHCGHLLAMEKAKSSGDYLIIHVASDAETRGVKGLSRPIIPGKERSRLVEGLKCVDEIVYSEKFLSLSELLDKVCPNMLYLNVGSNPENAEEECKKRGILIIRDRRFISKSGLDTTGIVKKIKESDSQLPIAGVNFLIIDKKTKSILLQKRDNKKGIRCPGKWCIPGGALNNNENPLMAAVREIEEEIGIVLSPRRLEMIFDWQYPWGDVNRVFVVSLPYSMRSKIKSNEGEMEWWSFNEANKLKLAANQNKLLNQYDKTKL